MATTRYYLALQEPKLARGSNPELSFTAHGAPEFAAQLQAALRSDALFQRWRAGQEEPDEVDPSLGVVDPHASVSGEQGTLRINLIVLTTLSGSVLKHRLHLLAGDHWELRNVSFG